MVQCDKEDAFRAKENAIKMMDNKEFVAARKIVLEVQRLYPELEGISHLLTICDVHCAAEAKVNKKMDWYKIIQVEQSADETIIRKQYLKLCRSLHTDKNGFPGAGDAFKLVSEAYSTLHDPIKRNEYDMVTKKKNDIKECDMIRKKDGIKTNLSTFWTRCPHCHTRYHYNFVVLNKRVRCLLCKWNFTAYNLMGQDCKPSSSSVYNGSQVPVNKFQFQKRDITPSQQVHHANTSSAGRVTDVKVQMSSPNQDRSSFPADNKNTHVSLMTDSTDPNIIGTHKSGIQAESAKHSAASGFVDGKPRVIVAQYKKGSSSAGGKKKAEWSEMLREGVGIPMKSNNNTGGGSMPYRTDPNTVDRVNLLGSEGASKVLSPPVEKNKRNQDADGNTGLKSDSNKKQSKNDPPSTHVDNSFKKISVDSVTSVDRKPAPTYLSREANIKEKGSRPSLATPQFMAAPQKYSSVWIVGNNMRPSQLFSAETSCLTVAGYQTASKTTGTAPMQAAPVVQLGTSRRHSSWFFKAEDPEYITMADKVTDLKRRKLEGAGKMAAARAVPDRAPPDSSSGRPSGASA